MPRTATAPVHGGMNTGSLLRRRTRELLRASAAVLAAGLAGCRSGGGDPSISARDLRAHVEALTSARMQGRLAGTAGYDSAAAYAAAVLQAARVEGAGIAGGGAGRGRYFQPIPMVLMRIGPAAALELRNGRGTSLLPHGRRTFLLLEPGEHPRSTPARPPVFVGNGIHAPEYGVDDFAGLDLSGRAVLLTAFPPRGADLARLPPPVARMYGDPTAAQRRRLTDVVGRGAAAILLLPDRWVADEWDAVTARQQQLSYRTAEPLPGSTPAPPLPVAMLHADVVDRLFLGRGYHPISHAGSYRTFALDDIALRLRLDVRPDPFSTANVVAVVPGRDRSLRDEYVVVAAQLDGEGAEGERVLPGARQAAACAALLEAAAAVAANPPRRSVLFALFAAEAGGRWGSRYFLAHPPITRGGRIVAALTVGRVGEGLGADEVTQAYAVGPLLSVAGRVASDGPRHELDVHDAAGHPGAFRGTSAESFQQARVPALLLTAGGAASSSTSHDNVKAIDWHHLLQATRRLHALTVEAANARSLVDSGSRPRT